MTQEEKELKKIQWTGNNLKEVIEFTGRSPKFDEWFKTWEEYEEYVRSHGNIFKLFFEDGSHYEVPVGSWIIKTPDGYNLPSVAKYIQQEHPEVNLEKEATKFVQSKEFIESEESPVLLIARHFFNLGLNARK